MLPYQLRNNNNKESAKMSKATDIYQEIFASTSC